MASVFRTVAMDDGDVFGRLRLIKVGETDLEGTAHQVVHLAEHLLPGAAAVSVTLLRGADVRTVASTGAVALTLDRWQYDSGEGPCLDAAASVATVPAHDLSSESRWPRWVQRAADMPVRSVLSIGLEMHESVAGALNVYATQPDAFDDDQVVLAQTFARYAAVALANVHLYDTQTALAQHMQAAMVSRAVIEQAKGIIMGERRCTADEAFAILAQLSRDTNRKLRDIAAILVDRAAHTAQRQSDPRSGDSQPVNS
jgi:GAF domain-containing protein